MRHTVYFRGTRAGLLARLRKLVAGLSSSPTPASSQMMTRIGLAIQAKISEQFQIKMNGGTDETGLRWAPLSPATLRRRSKHRTRPAGPLGTAGSILYDTGDLLASLSPAIAPEAAGPGPPAVRYSIFDVSGGRVKIGTTRPGASDQHNGTPTIPARPLYPEPADWTPSWWAPIKAEAAKAVAEWLTRELDNP